MNMTKKFGALFCAAALVFGLTACGGGAAGGGSESVADLLNAADEKLSSAESVSMAMLIDMDMSATAEGETQSLVISAEVNGDLIMDPMKMYGDIDLDLGDLGGKMSLEMYLQENEDMLDMYIGMMGYWMQQSMDISAVESAEASSDFDLYTEANFKSDGKDDIGEKYTGTLTGAAMEKLMNTPELLETLEQMDDAMGMNIDWAEIYSDMGDMTMSIWIDGEGYPVRYEIDAADMANKIVEKALEVVADSMGADMGDAAVTFDTLLISIDFTNINAVEDFDVPVDTMQFM